MDHSLCYQTSREVTGACSVPLSYGFSFGQLMANCTIPVGGRSIYFINISSKFSFEMKDLKVVSAGSGVQPADISFFE